MAYVTGSHAFKAGIQSGRGHEARYQTTGGGGIVCLVQRYRVGVPDSVAVYNTPVNDDNSGTVRHRHLCAGFVDDESSDVQPGRSHRALQLVLSRRRSAPAGRFIAARNFPAEPESEQPHWKDVAPRIGAVYDLLGDNTTAVKASWGRYVRTYHGAFSSAYNPMVLTSDTRTWKDLNKDDIAQGDLSCDMRDKVHCDSLRAGCEIGPPTKRHRFENDASAGSRHQAAGQYRTRR